MKKNIFTGGDIKINIYSCEEIYGNDVSDEEKWAELYVVKIFPIMWRIYKKFYFVLSLIMNYIFQCAKVVQIIHFLGAIRILSG